MLIPTVQVTLLGGLLCLDRVVVQVMISRPVVAGALVGTLLGDPLTGLVTGAMIELLWIDRFPMGRYLPPNDTVVAILVSAGSILAGRTLGGVSPELIALAVLLFSPAAFIARGGDAIVAQSNNRLSAAAVRDARHGDSKAIDRKHYLGMVKLFGLSAAIIFILLVPGVLLLQAVFPMLPERIIRTLHLVYYFIPLLGIAVALSTIKIRGSLPVFAGLFLVVMIVTRLW